jgi:Spy/CpxP family protein refolding chaperone
MLRREVAQHAAPIFGCMMHLAIGLGLLGFFLARRHRQRVYGGLMGSHGCGMYGGWHGPSGHGPGPRGFGRRGFGHHGRKRRFFLRRLLRELDATPAQERAIVAELERLEQHVRTAGEVLRGGRPELAAALSAPVLDEEALKAATSRMDAAAAEVREATVGAMRALHALLDEGQRRHLAELLDHQPWWRGGGMYR